jgi:hypothetical protein
MAENKEGSSTTVTTVDLDIDNILGTPGAENIMVPSEGQKTETAKPSIFSSKPVDMSFIDNDDEDADQSSSTTGSSNEDSGVKTKTIDQVNSDLDELNGLEGEKSGRPKMEKSAMIELAKKLIEKKQLIPFDDDKPIEKYSLQDFEELFEANMEEKERKLRSEIPLEFFDNLPEELQVAAKYVADGGADLKGLFRTLAQVEEVRQLDPQHENDQEQIVRAYLHATQFGSSEDIEEEINAWKDRDELAAKANKFKPKLDAMQQQVVARQLQQQEQMRKQQQQQAQMYMDNVYKVLDPGEINGIKLDKKTQSMLYAGLVQPNYPSISGRSTNLLGHLLEKYQYVEPRHDLIAEALWLLSDPEGYRSKVKEGGKKEANEKTVRMLKTEEASKVSSSTATDDEESPKQQAQQRLQRPTSNFFKR